MGSKTAFGAIVHGPAGQCFDWVCWGVQRGFEGVYADVSDAEYPEEENRGAALLDAAETEAAVSLPLTIEERVERRFDHEQNHRL